MDNESYQGMVDIVCSFRTENLDARLKARDKVNSNLTQCYVKY